jgi:hypothetical protein
MTTLFNEIESHFKIDLVLVKEERPSISVKEQIDIAKSYTQETLTEFLDRIADNRYQAHVEAVNKTHFPII